MWHNKAKHYLKKSANIFGYWSRNANKTPSQQYNDYLKEKTFLEQRQEKIEQINIVMQFRNDFAENTLPVKRSIEILQNLIYSTPVIWKDKQGNPLETNPIEDLFENNPGISFMHQGYRDFLYAVVKRLCGLDGVLYLLVEMEGSSIANINVIPSNYILPYQQPQNTQMIMRYAINNILGLRNVIFEYTENGYYESINSDREFRLFASDIIFEESISGVQLNLSKSPLIAIAQQIYLFDSVIARAVSINKNGASANIIAVGTEIKDPEAKAQLRKEYTELLQGAHNAGGTQVMIVEQDLIGKGGNVTNIPVGSKASDYAIQNDLETSENLVYGNYGISASFAKQEAKYVGNQAESLRQLYESKIFIEVARINNYIKKWLFPILGYDPTQFYCEVDKTQIDVFLEKEVAFVQGIGDVLTINEKRQRLHYEALEEEDDMEEDKKEEDDTEEDDMGEEIEKSIKLIKSLKNSQND